MKVYSLPKDLPAPKPDYKNWDSKKEQAREQNHTDKLKEHLLKQGFTGKMTGKIYREGVGDGYALYMVADVPKEVKTSQSFLVHLPYGDAYQSRNVSFIPKTEIFRRIKTKENFKKIFNSTPRA